jgi:hypothetical protein
MEDDVNHVIIYSGTRLLCGRNRVRGEDRRTISGARPRINELCNVCRDDMILSPSATHDMIKSVVHTSSQKL